MLELIIAVLPGILAVVIYRIQHGQNVGEGGGLTNRRNVLAYILFYTFFTNALILTGLHMIGMYGFNLFEMSVRFKVKWIVLEVVISLLFAWTNRNLCRLNLAALKQMAKRLFPSVLFFLVTYAVFTPSSLFLQNMNEFSITYSKIVPVILAAVILLTAFFYVSAICLTDEKMLHFFIAFVFGVALCAYVQGNFLNPAFPSLDGTEIAWASYQKENRISLCFWLSGMGLCLVCARLWKEKTEKAMKYLALFLSSVQMVTLMVLLFTTRQDSYVNYGFSKEEEFAIGSNGNIIIFLVDTLQASSMEKYLTSEACAEGFLDDFTFFDNAVSGGASTRVALPLLLTGVEYDPMQPLDEYVEEIWEETDFYTDLCNNGYDVRFYTTAHYFSRLPDGIANNYAVTGDSWIYDYPVFGTQLYKLVNFYLMPQFLKPYFWLSENKMMSTITCAEGGYVFDDVQFYQDFKAAQGLQERYDKSFRLYHLQGVHKPYLMNENIERLEEGKDFVTEQQILQGNMKIIADYIGEMKRIGVYENSTIVILGDHGRHEDDNLEANPAVLLKRPYEAHELTHNSAPVHFRNLVASIAGTIMEDYSAYGPSLYDISKESDVERLHTVHRSIRARITLEEPVDETLDYSRFIVGDQADSRQFRLWNPYEINRISYRMGDVIDFTVDNAYAKQLDYRLYKEHNAAVASNELSMCLDLGHLDRKDLEFHFTYGDLYGDSQKIRIYANGHKVTTITCKRDQIGKDMVITIPEETLGEDELIIRMVFPGAVTPNQLDRTNPDMRVLSVAFTTMYLK